MILWGIIYFFIFLAIIIRILKVAGKVSDNVASKEDNAKNTFDSDNIFGADKKFDSMFKENNNPIREKSSRRKNI